MYSAFHIMFCCFSLDSPEFLYVAFNSFLNVAPMFFPLFCATCATKNFYYGQDFCFYHNTKRKAADNSQRNSTPLAETPVNPRFFYLFKHYFKSLLQKEITIHHKNNIKTTLNYINIKGKMCTVTKKLKQKG